MSGQRPEVTWIPLHAGERNGLRMTLAGNAKVRLSEKISAPKNVDVTNLRREAIGKIESINNDHGALTVVVMLNEGAGEPGGKFLLGLIRRGVHMVMALCEAELRAMDVSPQRYVGMLGEDL